MAPRRVPRLPRFAWIWLGALVFGVIAGCGDDDGGNDASVPTDASAVDAAKPEPRDASSQPEAAMPDATVPDASMLRDAQPEADAATVDDGDAGAPACIATKTCAAVGEVCTSDDACATGHCSDGYCCDAACGGGSSDCQACSRALTGKPNGQCHPLPSGTRCRDSAGSCDFAEVCDGASAACPGDVLLPAGIVCRSSAGACDTEEQCTGSSPTCPADTFRAAGVQCRASIGPCDLEDTCSGSSAACPDTFRPQGYACNATLTGPCDAPDQCTGNSPGCPATYLSGVICRYGRGACDLTEVCAGTSPNCPPDLVVSSGIVCRPSINLACDPTERCDGVSYDCPADVETCP